MCFNFLSRFYKDNNGNFSIMAAVVMMMLIMGAGAAIDYSRAESLKSKMQDTADSAVLGAAKSGETDRAALQIIAQNIIDTNIIGISNEALTLTITNQGRLQVLVSGQYDTMIMPIFGVDNIDIKVVSEAPLAASEPINIALVLDTTGSMRGSKLASLKSAATDLITTLEDYNNDSLKVSVVPFAKTVNVGLGNRNASWITVPADNSTTGAEVCRMRRDVTSRSNCRTVARTCYNDGVPYSCPRRVCDYTYGPEYEQCWTPTSNSTWRGCVGSRIAPWHERVAYSSRKIPGLMNERCGRELLPLTNNMRTVKAKIASLNATGSTYIPAGLAWGWRTLSTSVPLTQANGPFANNTDKVMILMTDGSNTKSKSGIRHNGNNVVNANNVTNNLCTKIKDDEIKVYTIAYEITDTPTRNLIRNCATDASMFFNASNAAQLQAAFDQIGASLIKVRLTN